MEMQSFWQRALGFIIQDDEPERAVISGIEDIKKMKIKRKLSLNACCCRSEESDGILEKKGDQQNEQDNRKGREKKERRCNLAFTFE